MGVPRPHFPSHQWRCWDTRLISLPSSLVTLLSSPIQLSPPLSLRVTAHWKTNILTRRTPPTPPIPTPGPSINYVSLYCPPPLSLHPPLPPYSDCNRILPAAYSLHAFITVSHLRRALRGQEKKKKQNKQNIKLAAEGELWCGRCRCHAKRRRPGGKVCLESVVCPPCWAREPLIQDIPESERTFFTDQETIIWTWIKLSLKFDLV